MTANRFRVQAPLTQHLGLPQPMKLPPVHHLSRVASQVTEGGTHPSFSRVKMICGAYRITVMGYLDREWSDWFDGLAIPLVGSGETILTGPLADQTALHGVLINIRDVGLPLLSLVRVEPERGKESNLPRIRRQRDSMDEGCNTALLRHGNLPVGSAKGSLGVSCLAIAVVNCPFGPNRPSKCFQDDYAA